MSQRILWTWNLFVHLCIVKIIRHWNDVLLSCYTINNASIVQVIPFPIINDWWEFRCRYEGLVCELHKHIKKLYF